jgi:sporulation protein YqfC
MLIKRFIDTLTLKRKLISALDLPNEILLPVMTVIGGNELRIVNYKGVIEYNGERIRLNTQCGVIVIEGKAMVLNKIGAEDVVLSGKITRIEMG